MPADRQHPSVSVGPGGTERFITPDQRFSLAVCRTSLHGNVVLCVNVSGENKLNKRWDLYLIGNAECVGQSG